MGRRELGSDSPVHNRDSPASSLLIKSFPTNNCGKQINDRPQRRRKRRMRSKRSGPIPTSPTTHEGRHTSELVALGIIYQEAFKKSANGWRSQLESEAPGVQRFSSITNISGGDGGCEMNPLEANSVL